jgi:hypothetical protein
MWSQRDCEPVGAAPLLLPLQLDTEKADLTPLFHKIICFTPKRQINFIALPIQAINISPIGFIFALEFYKFLSILCFLFSSFLFTELFGNGLFKDYFIFYFIRFTIYVLLLFV